MALLPPKFWYKTRKKIRFAWKDARRFLVYALTLSLCKGIVILPPAWARGLGAVLGRLTGWVAWGERKKVLRHLELAYGDTMPAAERKRIAGLVFVNAGISAVEWCFMLEGRLDRLGGEILVEGQEHIDRAFQSGRGVIMLSAHYGNWERGVGLMRHLFPGREFGAVARDLSNPWLNQAVNRARQLQGARVFARGASGKEYIRFLRAGNALAILGDMDTTRGGGIFVDFFGRPAYTQEGIARLARLSRAVIIPGFPQRDPENLGRCVYKFRPPVPEPEGVDEAEYIRQVTQSFTRDIEQAVRERPELWMWMHERWRRQPGDFPEDRENLARPSRNQNTGS